MAEIRIKEGATRLEFLFALSITLLLAAFVVVALDFRTMDRRAPLAVGIPTLILSSIISLSYLSERADRVISIFDQTVFAEAGAVKESVEDEIGTEVYIDNGIPRALGWLIGLSVLFYLFGIIVSTMLFVYLYLTIEGKIARLRSTIVALAVAGAIYGVFEIGLGRALYEGVVFETLFELL